MSRTWLDCKCEAETDRRAKRKEDEVRGIDFTLWLYRADSSPLIISGGVEELIYSVVTEGSHLSPRKPNSLTCSWSIIWAAVTVLATGTHLINPAAEAVQGCSAGNRADFSKGCLFCTGVRCHGGLWGSAVLFGHAEWRLTPTKQAVKLVWRITPPSWRACSFYVQHCCSDQ